MTNDKPPAINGIMELSEAEKTDIKEKLLQIQVDFIAEEIELNTHGLVSRYNCNNPNLLINGDTAEYLLKLSE